MTRNKESIPLNASDKLLCSHNVDLLVANHSFDILLPLGLIAASHPKCPQRQEEGERWYTVCPRSWIQTKQIFLP